MFGGFVNPAARALGKLAAGKPKTMSAEAMQQRKAAAQQQRTMTAAAIEQRRAAAKARWQKEKRK